MFCQLQRSFEIDNFEKQRFYWSSPRRLYGFTSNSIVKAHLLSNRDPCYRLSPKHSDFHFSSLDLILFLNESSWPLVYGKNWFRILKAPEVNGFCKRIFFCTQFPDLAPRFKERESYIVVKSIFSRSKACWNDAGMSSYVHRDWFSITKIIIESYSSTVPATFSIQNLLERCWNEFVCSPGLVFHH